MRCLRGWVIVAAGNPPAYNRSVREFDTPWIGYAI